MKYLDITRKEGYKIVKLSRGKANVINHELVQELSEVFYSLEEDTDTKGTILIGQPDFFSAGLDVIELYDYNEDQIRKFFTDFIGLYDQLMRFTKPLICGVTGHSPAGGTVLAITADYRVMAEDTKYSIGLNEVAVNVQISQVLINGYAFWLGEGLASRLILQGKLLNPSEALDIGLVDELCTVENVLMKCEQMMNQYLMADDDIFIYTKKKLRRALFESFDRVQRDMELADSLNVWHKPEIKERMSLMVEYLIAKKGALKA